MGRKQVVNISANGEDHLQVSRVHGEVGGGASLGLARLQQCGPAAAMARSGLGKAEG